MNELCILILYNLLFFWKIYSNPSCMARSELLSTFFPTWIWQGKEWRRLYVPRYDPYYWLNAHSHPVISTYYPPHILTAVISSFLSLDNAFNLLVISTNIHYLVCSCGWFLLCSTFSSKLAALFGAITLTYSGYNIKQQPCIVYTFSWFPWLLLGIAQNNMLLASFSCGMILLAGYYPIGIQVLGIAELATIAWRCPWLWIPIGLAIGSIQLVPFLRYLPKTIRMHANKSVEVGFWEKTCYPGVTALILVCFSTSKVWMLLITSLLLYAGLFSKYLPRIPSRWLFTVQFCLGWMAVSGLNGSLLSNNQLCLLLFIQAFDLYWHNKDLIPTLPYAELYQRPSWAFNTKLIRYLKEHLNAGERVSGLPYPLFTGHINQICTLGYCGGMQLKLMAKWRKDTNPNGSGNHDWFKTNEDNISLDRARVRFTISNKKLDWKPTKLKHLWENPRYKLQAI